MNPEIKNAIANKIPPVMIRCRGVRQTLILARKEIGKRLSDLKPELPMLNAKLESWIKDETSETSVQLPPRLRSGRYSEVDCVNQIGNGTPNSSGRYRQLVVSTGLKAIVILSLPIIANRHCCL